MWKLGNGNGKEKQLGQVQSYGECITLVRSKAPDANSATVTKGGKGECFAEWGSTAATGSAHEHCIFGPICEGGKWILGDGNGKKEKQVGQVQTYSECITLVRSKAPDATSATVTKGGKGACYAEWGSTAATGSGFEHCIFDQGRLVYPSIRQ